MNNIKTISDMIGKTLVRVERTIVNDIRTKYFDGYVFTFADGEVFTMNYDQY